MRTKYNQNKVTKLHIQTSKKLETSKYSKKKLTKKLKDTDILKDGNYVRFHHFEQIR